MPTKSELFGVLKEYRLAVQARDIPTIKQFHADYPQHQRMFDACFKAVTRRLRFTARNITP